MMPRSTGVAIAFIRFSRRNVSPGKGVRRQGQFTSEPRTSIGKGGRCFLPHKRHSATLHHMPERQHNATMRWLAGLLVFVGIGFGIYQYSLKRMPVSDAG